MNYWIFVVTARTGEDRAYSPRDIYEQRMTDGFWGLGEKTPNRRKLALGDQVVFYLGNPDMSFAGTAALASAYFQVADAERERLTHGQQVYTSDYGVQLTEVTRWTPPKSAEALIPDLQFIENKEYWPVYFRGGIRQIPEIDFHTITEGRGLSPPPNEIVSKSEFELEKYLEEFIEHNWNSIDFKSKLMLYENGRQFPAGPERWSIDFLCKDMANGDFVVIELKRGKSSDSTVGQVLRYMSWVKENEAEPGQRVRGIIIARKVDEALRYAIKGLNNVSVLTYEVDFRLSAFDK